MDTLQEALAAFDDPCKKRLDYHHVSASLSQLPDEIRRSFKTRRRRFWQWISTNRLPLTLG